MVESQDDLSVLEGMIVKLAESWEREVKHLKDQIEENRNCNDYMACHTRAERASHLEICAIRLRELITNFHARMV